MSFPHIQTLYIVSYQSKQINRLWNIINKPLNAPRFHRFMLAMTIELFMGSCKSRIIGRMLQFASILCLRSNSSYPRVPATCVLLYLKKYALYLNTIRIFSTSTGNIQTVFKPYKGLQKKLFVTKQGRRPKGVSPNVIGCISTGSLK